MNQQERLVVIHADDQRLFREKVRKVIKSLNLVFQGVENGEEVLDILEILSENVALIILDWEMPVLNGYNCLMKIKSCSKYDEIPVIFYSGISSNDLKKMAVDKGAEKFISKSRESGYLKKTIAEMLKKKNDY
ncbi:MAG: response regulator [bacterium]